MGIELHLGKNLGDRGFVVLFAICYFCDGVVLMIDLTFDSFRKLHIILSRVYAFGSKIDHSRDNRGRRLQALLLNLTTMRIWLRI